MFASPFFGGGGGGYYGGHGNRWGASPYERAAAARQSPYAHDPYRAQRQRELQLQRQQELEARRRAEMERRAELERSRRAQYEAEMARRRQAQEEYERELYEQEMARRQQRRGGMMGGSDWSGPVDLFGRPIMSRAQRAHMAQQQAKAEAERAAKAEAEAAARREQAERKAHAQAVRRFRQRVAAQKIQRWWRAHLDAKYNPKPDPRIEVVDEAFHLPPHRILPDSVENVIMPLGIAA